MAKQQQRATMSVYIPQSKMKKRLLERLIRLGEQRDRSVNYLVIEAIIEYLDRVEEKM
jgi:predicted DNA-binding protein